MSDLNIHKIISTYSVNKEDFKSELKKEALQSNIDNYSNIILVNNDDPDKPIIHHVMTENTSNFENLEIGKKITLGNAKGIVAFVDDGSDDFISSSSLLISRKVVAETEKKVDTFLKSMDIKTVGDSELK